MATIEDFILKLRRVVEELNVNRESESVQVGSELMAQVRLRVQNDKEDSQGNSFGAYSTTLVPKFFFYNKSMSGAAEKKVRSRPSLMSYEDLRADNNLETDSKDFTFSGEMWRNTGVTEVKNTTQSTSVSIGGTSSRSERLIGLNSERDGNIIEPNEQEIQNAVEAHTERVLKVINKYLL